VSLGKSERMVFKKVFLTFDDGPGPKSQELAKLLKDNGVKATFFMTGENIERFPNAVRWIKTYGHTIGVHSYSHKPLATLTLKDAIRDIKKTAQLITRLTGRKPTLYRAPFGILTPEMRIVLKKHGLKHVDWSYDTLDWKNAEMKQKLNPIFISHRVKRGDVVLFHDGAAGRQQADEKKRGENLLEAMPLIIWNLKQRGFSIEPLKKSIQFGQRLKYYARMLERHRRALKPILYKLPKFGRKRKNQ